MVWSYFFVWPLLVFLLSRVEANGLNNIPKKGGLIVASVHPNSFDEFFLGAVLWRQRRQRVWFIVDERVGKWVPAWLAKKFGLLIKKNRGDRSVLKKAEILLKKGFVLVVYFEGGRIGRKVSRKPKTGAMWLHFQTGAPLLPVWIGSPPNHSFWQGVRVLWKIFFYEKVRVRIGKLLNFSAGDSCGKNREFFKKLREATFELKEKVEALGQK